MPTVSQQMVILIIKGLNEAPTLFFFCSKRSDIKEVQSNMKIKALIFLVLWHIARTILSSDF